MPACQICKKENSKFFHKIDKYSYYICTRCQTLFLYPKPSDRLINRYYKQNFEYSAGKINENKIRSRSRKILKLLKKLNPKGKSLLDIGSGYGFFLSEAMKYGLNSVGVEPSKTLANVSINQLIGTIVKNEKFDLYYASNKSTKFDFITLIHTIEHVPLPQAMLDKISKLLNKNGILFLETPNSNSHLFVSEMCNYTFLTPPDHIWIFSKKSFQTMLNKIPIMEIVKISTYSYPEHLMGIIKKLLKRKEMEQVTETGRVPTVQIPFLPRWRSGDVLHQSNTDVKEVSDKVLMKKYFKYYIFDKLFAPILTPLLNIDDKGSILELYIRKK